MAEAILRDMLSERADAAEWSVRSAGTWGMDGYHATSRAQIALRKSGISADNHIARTVTREILESADLILTMEIGHKEALQLEFPQEANKIYLLAEMVGARFDIQDPIGGPQTDFDITVVELRKILEQAIEVITQLATDSAASRDL
jgi:protein-tyrosine-phosphatase